MSRIAVVVLSGGQDSTTCLASLMEAMHKGTYNDVFAVSVNYGQRHLAELHAAYHIAELAGLDFLHHETIDVPYVLIGASPLVNSGTKVEEYASADVLPGGLEKTFVPMRNTLFLTLAANRAVVDALECGASEVTLVTGVSMEDYGGYPDCREHFIDLIEAAFRASLDDKALPTLHIAAPLMHMTKKQTVEWSESIEGARELLAWSHTCYNGAVPPCGKCHACLLRAKGYAEAGVIDPLLERLQAANVKSELDAEAESEAAAQAKHTGL